MAQRSNVKKPGFHNNRVCSPPGGATYWHLLHAAKDRKLGWRCLSSDATRRASSEGRIESRLGSGFSIFKRGLRLSQDTQQHLNVLVEFDPQGVVLPLVVFCIFFAHCIGTKIKGL